MSDNTKTLEVKSHKDTYDRSLERQYHMLHCVLVSYHFFYYYRKISHPFKTLYNFCLVIIAYDLRYSFNTSCNMQFVQIFSVLEYIVIIFVLSNGDEG